MMYTVLELLVDEDEASRRAFQILSGPVGTSIDVKCLIWDGIVFGAIGLPELKMAIVISFWQHERIARELFKGGVSVIVRSNAQGKGVAFMCNIAPTLIDRACDAALQIGCHPSEETFQQAVRACRRDVESLWPGVFQLWGTRTALFETDEKPIPTLNIG